MSKHININLTKLLRTAANDYVQAKVIVDLCKLNIINTEDVVDVISQDCFFQGMAEGFYDQVEEFSMSVDEYIRYYAANLMDIEFEGNDYPEMMMIAFVNDKQMIYEFMDIVKIFIENYKH